MNNYTNHQSFSFGPASTPSNDLAAHRGSTAHIRGGAVSVQYGTGTEDAMGDDVAPQHFGLRVRDGTAAYAVNMADGNVRNIGHQSAPLGGARNDRTLLGTATTAFGSYVAPGDLTPADTIEVQGMRLTVEVAERIGILKRNEYGNYVEASAGILNADSGTAIERPFGDPAAPPVESFSPAVEASIQAVVDSTDAGTQISIINEISRTGRVSESTIGRLASNAMIEVGEAARFIDGVRNEFAQQASRSLGQMGVSDIDHFGDWISDMGLGEELSRAITNHVLERSAASYRDLAHRYVEMMDQHSPDDILAAEFGGGIKAHRDQGTVVLNIPGYGQVSWGAAVKAGLIRVGKR